MFAVRRKCYRNTDAGPHRSTLFWISSRYFQTCQPLSHFFSQSGTEEMITADGDDLLQFWLSYKKMSRLGHISLRPECYKISSRAFDLLSLYHLTLLSTSNRMKPVRMFQLAVGARTRPNQNYVPSR